MTYSDVMFATTNYMSLAMGLIWCIAFGYAGYKILSHAEPPKFLV